MEVQKTLSLTTKQEKNLLLLLLGEPNDLDLTKDQANQIMANLEKTLSTMYLSDDNRFGPASETFRITVPENYNHETQIDEFASSWMVEQSEHDKYHNKPQLVGYFDRGLTSKNYEKATYQLVPGKKYWVKLIPILDTVNGKDCLEFSKKQGAVLVGVQGLTLLCEIELKKLLSGYYTKGTRVYSLDEQQALFNNNIPVLCFTEDRHFVSCPNSLDFYTHEYEKEIYYKNFLLCFFELT